MYLYLNINCKWMKYNIHINTKRLPCKIDPFTRGFGTRYFVRFYFIVLLSPTQVGYTIRSGTNMVWFILLVQFNFKLVSYMVDIITDSMSYVRLFVCNEIRKITPFIAFYFI